MEQTFPFSFVLRIQVILLKIIDYGVCVSYLNRSLVNPYKNDIIISSIQKDLERINALNALIKLERV